MFRVIVSLVIGCLSGFVGSIFLLFGNYSDFFGGVIILVPAIIATIATYKALPDRQTVPSSSADELTKYAQMLKEGLLTQEEFDKKKLELL